MFIEGACALKTISKNLKIVFESLPELFNYVAPSCTTIKYWAAQVGYYKLTRPKPVRNDWMVMFDASIQMGQKKCVIAIGCTQSAFLKMKDRTLTKKDVEILSIQFVSEINGDFICSMLTQISSEIGTIISVCSDRGSEMLNGIKKFQLISPLTRQIGDTAHRVSNFFKAVLEKDPKSRWQEYRRLLTLARKKMLNSKVAGAAPPNSRSKARYMNLDPQIIWGDDILIIYDSDFDQIEWLSRDDFNKYLDFLPSFRDDINYWMRLVKIGKSARHIVRVEGIHSDIVDSFEKAIGHIKMGNKELQFADQISKSLHGYSNIMPNECFLGSSELLETIFGKIKYIEQEQRAFGFTSIVLSAIASVGPLNTDIINEAMREVKRSYVDDWVEKNIGKSIQAGRREIKRLSIKIRELKVRYKFNMGQKVSGNPGEKIAQKEEKIA